jgi:hypothetical protein
VLWDDEDATGPAMVVQSGGKRPAHAVGQGSASSHTTYAVTRLTGFGASIVSTN